jgi:bifunctional non-homologous end joining protein LigD
VLKSWAVPKGPSLDPGQNRLAMRTEDHPLDYGTFEGTIPKGEYGGGTVMLWDRGRWIPHPDKDPRKTIEEGHLHFTLEGERMHGEWVMFRLKGKPNDRSQPWMLKKVTDEFADPEDGEVAGRAMLTSVTTDRTMAEIAAGRGRVASNRAAERRPQKKQASVRRRPFEAPQLATLVDAVPSGPDWCHEYKYDGYRCCLRPGAARNRLDPQRQGLERQVPRLVKARRTARRCLIDGEAVALDDKWQARFPAASGDAQGRRCEPCLLRIRPADRSGRRHQRLAQHRTQAAPAALLKR